MVNNTDNKNEGIVLSDQVNAVESELRAERMREIARHIRNIVGRRTAAAGSIRDLEEKLAKAKAALAREIRKLERLEAGDWSVIEELERGNKENSANAKQPEDGGA